MSQPPDPSNIVIVGGGPAALATARSYRAAGGKAEVTLVCEEPRPPYERPPLSKELLRGETDAQAILIEKQGWFEEHGVRLRLGVAAESIDLQAGTVATSDGAQLRAAAIVIATGSEPLRPQLPGAEDAAVLTFRRLPDSRRLALRTRPGRPVVVIGSGFIGCEIAGSLALRGVAVTLVTVEERPQQERLGRDVGERIASWLGELGVELRCGVEVAAIHGGCEVELSTGEGIVGDCVVLGAGVRPRGELAADAGAQMHDGAVVVDESMRAETSTAADGAALLAVGDVAFARNAAAARHLRVEHWGDALGHGEVAGRTLAGEDGRWDAVPGFWTTIGRHTVKYGAWGDGHDECHLTDHAGGAFTVYYVKAGVLAGVLTHERDGDYERGIAAIAAGETPPS
ncbi:MAG TPA: FAD/NAD(P)-binding oxidoreductase [Solirubrobacteraceae bacterium]|jgi:NADPH-dependent 2,4-dienoyl-CoA reductase/sulfur reductase-like enzyme|nr:FAD/NAD(P)-binding oxidoreductase [Solirubrobacteraceae bacterium]